MATPPQRVLLNELGSELLVALCRYVEQHGNVPWQARHAAELLRKGFDDDSPVARDGKTEQARLDRALDRLSKCSKAGYGAVSSRDSSSSPKAPRADT